MRRPVFANSRNEMGLIEIVRLRETVRRLSNDWDAQPHSLKSA